jgi:hypothetical protein
MYNADLPRLGSFRKKRASPNDEAFEVTYSVRRFLVDEHSWAASFSALLLYRPSKAHAWPTTVLVDELHASFLKGSSYDIKGRATWLAPLLFELVDGHDADSRSIRQVLLAPTE